MNAKEWLDDIEAKADAAIAAKDSPDKIDRIVRGISFATAANPVAVKRLVEMVRMGAFNAARSKGLFNDPAYWIETAFEQTEPKP